MRHNIIRMADWYDEIIKQYHEERKTAKFYKTRGYPRLRQYVIAVIESERFQKKTKQMRDEYQIEAKGFSIPATSSWSHPPKTWEHEEDPKVIGRIRKELDVLCREYVILPRDWERTLECYLFYNRIMLSAEPNAKNLCFVSDGVTGKDSLGHVVDEIDREIYPITLHISAYAGIHDILDYVNKLYNPEIMRLQKQYRRAEIKIDKLHRRDKAVRERNAAMYEIRNDSNKKIANIVDKQFPKRPLRLSSIPKTIARERKRRQEL